MRRFLLCSCVSASMLPLSGCGGGSTSIAYMSPQGSSQSSGSDPTAPEAFSATDYIFPYRAGDHTVTVNLDTQDPASAQYPWFEDVTATATIDGHAGWIVSESGQFKNFVTIDSDSIRKYSVPEGGAALPPPMETYPTVLHLGDQFVVFRQSWIENDPISGNLVQAIRKNLSTVESVEDVTTRMGHFTQCLKVKNQEILTRLMDGKEIPATSTQPSSSWTWYCKGIGLVRWQNSDASFSSEMAAYEISDRRNETVAPTASLSGVPTAEQHWKLDTLKVTFDEPMRTSTLDATSIVITDNQHRVIEGEFATGPNWVTFKPHMGAMTEDGDYQLQVTSAAKDWAGNGAMPLNWTFHVDGHPPIPVGTTPANQSTGVPIDQVIQINFGEPVRVAYMPTDIAIIDLTLGSNAINVASAKFESGKVLIQSKLQPGHTYRVYFSQQVFYDLADNIWQDPLDFTFTTAP